MSEEMTKYEPDNSELIKLQKFISLTEEKPKVVKKHKQGFVYVPVDDIENSLNELFFGLWSWEISEPKIVGNEILVYGSLSVFHPVARVWIKRSGVGAAQIRMKKDSKPSLENKITTAVQMDAPHAEAEAFKNAAQKFGKIFGRGLRRDYQATYQPLLEEQPSYPEGFAEGLKNLTVETASEFVSKYHDVENIEEIVKKKLKEKK